MSTKLTPREPTPEMVEAERVKFEAWCAEAGVHTSYWLNNKAAGYDNSRTADYWTGWKARAMHDAAPAVQAEPVAWIVEVANPGGSESIKLIHRRRQDAEQHAAEFRPGVARIEPLYTHPAAVNQELLEARVQTLRDIGLRATETRRQLLVLHEINHLLYEHAKPAADLIDELMRHLGECAGALETMGHPIERTHPASMNQELLDALEMAQRYVGGEGTEEEIEQVSAAIARAKGQA